MQTCMLFLYGMRPVQSAQTYGSSMRVLTFLQGSPMYLTLALSLIDVKNCFKEKFISPFSFVLAFQQAPRMMGCAKQCCSQQQHMYRSLVHKRNQPVTYDLD